MGAGHMWGTCPLWVLWVSAHGQLQGCWVYAWVRCQLVWELQWCVKDR